uniref:Serpin-ZX n=1 Tax=Aegilops tauschii TaxID=37682 RepID=M8C135_AEGTA
MAATGTRLSIAHQTRFALRVASAISSPSNADGAAGNAAFSLLSLHIALSLIAADAGGATRGQLAATLGAEGTGEAESLHALAQHVVQLVLADASAKGGPRVAFANGLFVDTSMPLKSSFKEVAVGKYKAETHSVDFQTKAAEIACQVNTWVEKITSGIIKEILPEGSVDNTTRLVLGNALYFKGARTEEFDASKTIDGEFRLLDGSSVQAPFMSSTNEQYLSSYDNFKVSSEPEFLEKHPPTEKVPVRHFKLPKFKISFGFEASILLKGLGLHLPFSEEADLSKMVDSAEEQNLYVSSVFHKSFVELNEEGTEAAAATAAVVMLMSLPLAPPMEIDFIADHPFLFVIREDLTGVVLFVGHVVNPLLAA